MKKVSVGKGKLAVKAERQSSGRSGAVEQPAQNTKNILGSMWFSPQGMVIGIIIVEDVGENRAYIGVGDGLDFWDDEQRIAKYGVIFPLELAKHMIGIK